MQLAPADFAPIASQYNRTASKKGDCKKSTASKNRSLETLQLKNRFFMAGK